MRPPGMWHVACIVYHYTMVHMHIYTHTHCAFLPTHTTHHTPHTTHHTPHTPDLVTWRVTWCVTWVSANGVREGMVNLSSRI